MNGNTGSFDTDQNSSTHNRDVLTSLFGTKIGTLLFGSAIKISRTYNVDIGDVVQELAMAATEVERKYGYVHVTTACYKARDAITKTYNYGVNRYYTKKDVNVVSYDIDSEGDDPWVLSFADEGFDWSNIDTHLCVEQALSEITDPTDIEICRSLLHGLGPVEIGELLGIHYTTVIKRCRGRLALAFASSL